VGRPAVRVVTDSTCGLPRTVTEELGIGVVPLQVTLGGRSGLEGVDVRPADVVGALAAHEIVRTSQPSPAAFAAAYRGSAATGAPTDVLSIHLSAELSGTCGAAARAAAAAADAGLLVRVLDSRSTAMALGFTVLAAARTAADGAGAAQVLAAAREAVRQTDSLFCVQTLEHLRRGGRIGAAAALLGTALAVKPLLQVCDGRVVPREKVRTSTRALQRLEDLALELSGDGPVAAYVQHLAAPERAEQLRDHLERRLRSRLTSLGVGEVGPVVGAHLGPGLVGVVVHRG